MLTELRTNLRTPRRWPGESDRVRARASDELDRFEASWPNDAIQSSGPSASFDWLRAARMAFSEAAEVQIFAAECQHRILAAAALVGVRRGGILRQMPLGSELHEPTDLALQEARGLRCLASLLVRANQLISFDRLPASSPTIAALRRASWARAITIVRPAEAVATIELDDSWIEPERQLQLRQRRRLQQARKRAERIGPISIEIHTPDLNELPRLLDLVFELHEGQRRVASDDEAARQLGNAVFYRQYAEAACVSGSLRICVLRIGDRVAATQVGIEGDDTFWLLMADSSASFTRSQPAQLLMREVLKYCAEANLSRVSLWGAKQPWMQAWPLATMACVSLDLYPLRIRGAVALAIDCVVAVVRRLRQLAKR